jgi:hypothetical protein
MVALGLLPTSASAQARPAQDQSVIVAQEVDTVWTGEFGVPHPSGLAYIPTRDEFLVTGDSSGGSTPGVFLGPDEDFISSVALPSLDDFSTLVHDPSSDQITLVAGDSLVDVAIEASEELHPAAERTELEATGQAEGTHPESAAVDPATGDLLLLFTDSNNLVRVPRRSSIPTEERPLGPIADPLLIATNPSDGFVYVLDAHDGLYSIDEKGEVRQSYDMSSVELADPAAMVFAPSSDNTDSSDSQNLFIADSGGRETLGGVVEVSLAATTLAAVPIDTATLIQSIDASAWAPGSPDPSGVVHLPAPDELVVVDSEVDETTGAGWHDVNLWRINRNGTQAGTGALWGPDAGFYGGSIGFSREPTGAGFDPSTNTLFISDDDARRIFVITPGVDADFGTSDDIVGAINTSAYGSSDTEDPEFDVITGHLFFLDGTGREIYRIDPIDGVFGNGDDVMSHFDISHLGPTDFEGLASNAARGTLYVGARTTGQIFEITNDGTLLREISVAGISSIRRISGLAVAPASDGSGGQNFWIVDRGTDNGSDPKENDGMVFEVSAPDSLGGSNLPPIVYAGPGQMITHPDIAVLDGTVIDDGLPDPPGVVTSSWSQLSGPGTVTFGDASDVDSTASFSTPGTYVLVLEADDSELTSSSQVTIQVRDPSEPITLMSQIASESDDAEERTSTTAVDLTSGDLDIVGGNGSYLVGLRFTSMGLEPGSEIAGATIQFQVDEATSGTANFNIRGEKTPDAPTFTTTTGNISSRSLTTASVPWSPPSWNAVGDRGPAQQTSNLGPIVQEIIGQPGWSAGNDIAFIISGNGDRVAEAVGGAFGAVLTIEFFPPGEVLPVVTVGANANASEPDIDGQLTFTRTGPTTDPLPVNYAVGGTAGANVDYTALSGTVTIPSGQTTTTELVQVIDDIEEEPNETVTLTITTDPAYTVGSPSSDTVTIFDDDALPVVTVTASDPDAGEPSDSGTFTFTRTGSTTGPLSVDYTVAGTATGGSDYQALSGSVTIPNGQASATVPVTVIDDSDPEPAETVVVTLSASASYTIGAPSSGTVTISDNELPANQPPIVEARGDSVVFPATANLDGTVSDDGLPNPPGSLTTAWTKVSGPGAVTFGNPSVVDTTATFSAPGVYELRLTADDGLLTAGDSVLLTAVDPNDPPPESVNFATFGDFGDGGSGDAQVAGLVDILAPDFIVTTGDNRYIGDIDQAVGQHYADYIGNYQGQYGLGSPINRFFPALGNHDIEEPGGIDVYLDYFSLPGGAIPTTNTSGNERYYDFIRGPVHFFILNSDTTEPDGRSPGSIQWNWLQARLAASTTPWQVVITHEPPFYSGGGNATLDWPYEEWGADAVLSGDKHVYERLQIGSIPYIISGLGGAPISSTPPSFLPESQFFYNNNHGLVMVEACAERLAFEFISVSDGALDSYAVGASSCDLPEVTVTATDAVAGEPADNGLFTFTRTGQVGGPLTVNYTITGTATGGSDYTALSGIVVIPSGQTSATVPVTVTDDTESESDETVTVTVAPDPAYTMGTPNSGTVTITDNDPPVVTVTATDPAAGEPADNGLFTFTRTGPVAGPLTVNYTVAGSATPGSDYQTLSGSVVIPSSQTSATVPVTVTDDTEIEGDESVTVTLAPDPTYTIGTPNSDTVTIGDDDLPVVTVSASDAVAGEPADNGLFTFTRTGPVGGPLTVTYTITGSATPGSDYQTLSGSVVIPSGQISATVAVTVTDDTESESDETVTVTVAPDPAYTIGTPNSGTVTISDNDPPVVTVTATDPAAGEPADNGLFTFTRTGPSTGDLTVNYTADGTATADTDYTSLSGTVTIPSGQASAAVPVNVIDDTEVEGDETVTVSLSPDSAYTIGTPNSGTVTISDDDVLPEVTVTATTDAAEPNVDGEFTFTRSGPVGGPLTVNYTITGTATGGSDYTALSGTVTIPSGQASAAVPVNVIDDTDIEGDETVTVTLTPDPAYTVGTPNTDTVTITDNDLPMVTVTATDAAASEPADNGEFTVTRTGPISSPLPVTYTITGSATPGSDYQTLSGSVVIPSGQTSATVAVTVIDDPESESDETVTVTLTPDPAYTVGTPNSDTVTISDNDPPVVTVDASDAAAGEPADNGEFTVTRTGPVAGPLTVNYTITGTATGGPDYTALSGTVTIPSGQASATMPVNVIDDTEIEGDETVTVTLTPDPAYTIGTPNTGTVTITDNDAPAEHYAESETTVLGRLTSGNYTSTFASDDVYEQLVEHHSGGPPQNRVSYLDHRWTFQVTGNNHVSLFVEARHSPNSEGDDFEFEYSTNGGNTFQALTPELVVTSTATDVVYAGDLPSGTNGTVIIRVIDTDRTPGNFNRESLFIDRMVIVSSPVPVVMVTSTDSGASESGGDAGALTFTRSGPTTSDLTLYYTVGGTATPGDDYEALSGSVVIPAGQSATTVSVTAHQDGQVEADEDVTVSLSLYSTYFVAGSSSDSILITDG